MMNKEWWLKLLGKGTFWGSAQSQAGVVSFLVLVYASTVLTAGAGLIGGLSRLGAGDKTLDAVAKYRKALDISSNPNVHTDVELNTAIKDFQKSLATAVQNTPGANSTLAPYSKFIPLQGRTTKNTAGKSESFPLTVFNYTHNTGKECGAVPVTIKVTVDGKTLGSVAPGKAITTNVPKGNHVVNACGKAPFNCVGLTLAVPKYTFVYFYWVCRQGLNPIDPQPAVEPVQMEIPGFDPALMDVVFADPPQQQ